MPRVALVMHGSAMLYETAIAAEILGVNRSDLSPAGEWELMGLSAPADVAARVIVTCLIGAQQLASTGDVDMSKRLTEVWTVILPGLRPTPDLAARIATGQMLRERARAQAAATAPTTMWRTLDV